MNKLFCSLLFTLLSIFSCTTTPQPIENTEGVSLKLAQYRSSQISDVAYDISFQIPEKKEESILSKLKITLSLKDLSYPIYLDFKESSENLIQLFVNHRAVNIRHEKEHLIIPQEFLKLGVNSLKIDFIAGDLSLNRNDDYLYTLLVPDRARTLFPCFDQPNIKATYKLSVRVPKTWSVLAGAHIETLINDGVNTTFNFRKSDPMSTYLFSFVTGVFQKAKSDIKHLPMNLLFRENDPLKTKVSIPAIFDNHQKSLDFLEDYTGTPFPFQKFDFATIPGFQYGGMEHTGAIQYRETILFLDENATQSQMLSRAKLIAHESAHMWFGNLVTMDWFNDVWMKEVFANFMADKIVNPLFSEINHDLQFLTAHYPSAYGVDRTQGSNPIRQELDNLKNAGSLYGSIIYNKAPIMMRQLELTLGEEVFKEGIQKYIKQYANGNANWNQLVAILDEKTELDLKNWSEVWVNSSGRPLFSEQIKYDENGRILEFQLTQNAEDGSEKIWPQAFELELVYPEKIKSFTVLSNSKHTVLNDAIGMNKPISIRYNKNGYGYGVFPSDVNNLKSAAVVTNEVSKAQIYLNAYENVLLGNMDMLTAYKSFVEGIRVESNELILRLLTRQASALFWYHLNDQQRKEQQPLLEIALLDRLSSEATINIKKTIFNTYQSIAYSQNGLTKLFDVWKEKDQIENLPLNRDDRTRLAQTLALYNHPQAQLILKEAKAKLTNADKIERFEFIEPALSNNPEIRSTFFKSFQEAKHREKESWVQTAAAYINHPLRQQQAIKDLHISLELLEEIQQTGDIFFPKRWLDATIGQYTSGKAFVLVQNYLEIHPDLDLNLRRKLLQASDKLQRKYSKR